MRLITTKLLLGDLFILILAILLPGIRGYENWRIYEYIILFIISGFAIFSRHKMKAS
jgi:hypothetical protein